MNKQLKKLIETDIAFSKMSVKKGAAKAFAYFFTDKATMLPNNNQPVFGKKKIVENLKAASVDTILSWQPKNGKISQSGDLGYTWGIYKASNKKNSGNKAITGKYLNVWVKQNNGSWKVLVDMGNNNSKNDKKK